MCACSAASVSTVISRSLRRPAGKPKPSRDAALAHIAVAEREGMKPERQATPVADLKPVGLAPDELRPKRE
jgi:hypothetical protein